jgi:hypothetical protein
MPKPIKRPFSKPRVDKTDPARFRRTTRATWHMREASRKMGRGPPLAKAKKVAELVLERIPSDSSIRGAEKKRMFRRSAHQALLYKKPIGAMHCAERCNLAIGLLNASGVKSWLARVVQLDRGKKQWHFHDFVEFASGEKIYTITFETTSASKGGYIILPQSVEENFRGSNPIVFRAADSKQIGGVDNWATYREYTAKLTKNLVKEIDKNQRRINLLVRNGLIPQEALWHI